MTTPGESTRLGEIGQILVPITDLEASVRFYRDVLGLPHIGTFPHIALVQAGGTRLFLNDAEPEAFQGKVTLYFTVEDIDRAHRDLEDRGATFLGAPHVVHDDGRTSVWLAFMRDPDGHNIAIMQERTAQGEAGAQR